MYMRNIHHVKIYFLRIVRSAIIYFHIMWHIIHAHMYIETYRVNMDHQMGYYPTTVSGMVVVRIVVFLSSWICIYVVMSIMRGSFFPVSFFYHCHLKSPSPLVFLIHSEQRIIRLLPPPRLAFTPETNVEYRRGVKKRENWSKWKSNKKAGIHAQKIVRSSGRYNMERQQAM